MPDAPADPNDSLPLTAAEAWAQYLALEDEAKRAPKDLSDDDFAARFTFPGGDLGDRVASAPCDGPSAAIAKLEFLARCFEIGESGHEEAMVDQVLEWLRPQAQPAATIEDMAAIFDRDDFEPWEDQRHLLPDGKTFANDYLIPIRIAASLMMLSKPKLLSFAGNHVGTDEEEGAAFATCDSLRAAADHFQRFAALLNGAHARVMAALAKVALSEDVVELRTNPDAAVIARPGETWPQAATRLEAEARA